MISGVVLGCKLIGPNTLIWWSHTPAEPDTCPTTVLRNELDTCAFHCLLHGRNVVSDGGSLPSLEISHSRKADAGLFCKVGL